MTSSTPDFQSHANRMLNGNCVCSLIQIVFGPLVVGLLFIFVCLHFCRCQLFRLYSHLLGFVWDEDVRLIIGRLTLAPCYQNVTTGGKLTCLFVEPLGRGGGGPDTAIRADAHGITQVVHNLHYLE
jgi:hypothetical protein